MSLFATPDDDLPPVRQAPLEIAESVWVIRGIYRTSAMSTNLNAMVIGGREPMLVDTGMGVLRESWLEDVFSLVEPEAVRWIFVTHDDFDHTGNLMEALARCPNARLIVNRASSWRTCASFGIPESRVHTVTEGETFELGGRRLQALRPPVFDSPYTLGMLDLQTRAYYASDAFCTPMPVEPVDRVDEMPEVFWTQGMAKYHQNSLCPWIALVDMEKFRPQVERLSALDLQVIAGAHTPVIPHDCVNDALAMMAALPETAPASLHLEGVGAALPESGGPRD
ncbi:MBL fold metallo-hydrolase [Mangrovimicrobium sediminis]|uniref:MBL fold metallo-hydrolase n=1 Tax=Mangrovimicrobium sediminis TaxID=2562682 RepID=A0A4Z0LYS4_9GAMM|nr:MBL fold metallo-hydrolase [Haliea sp. SAOS-164]TGD72317.1 MBL fold metallo-hydrolase [Haliea sp. SAOS-164]